MAMVISGPAVGEALEQLLEQVLEERLHNERAALLKAVKEM